jgi:hypothetical protein
MLAAMSSAAAPAKSGRFISPPLPQRGVPLHQVRIEVGEEDLPADEHELDEFRGCLLEASERGARQFIADRHVEVEGV